MKMPFEKIDAFEYWRVFDQREKLKTQNKLMRESMEKASNYLCNRDIDTAEDVLNDCLQILKEME